MKARIIAYIMQVKIMDNKKRDIEFNLNLNSFTFLASICKIMLFYNNF